MSRLTATTCAAALLLAAPVAAQDMPAMDHSKMDHGAAPPAPADPHAGHDMAGMDQSAAAQSGGAMSMPDPRIASGTAWQPAVTPHEGVHLMAGPWTVMLHATLNGVVDSQGGRRGDDKTFVSGMAMALAQRNVGSGGDTWQVRAMLSPDPFMGKRGYPLLLASGETADGVTPLVDRQHPHDLFMELSSTYTHRLAPQTSVFLYGGLPGEPAFGPPAFMHRLSILDSPEAPISHHWLDSTHITFGVLTAGLVHGDWKVEASRFHGREPDEHRYDIETGALDSTAARLSWNPTPNLSLQASWADVKSPEQLEPDENQTKWSASGIYTVPFGDGGWWSTTAAWGRRSSGHEQLDAYVLESAVKPNEAWTIFARAERTENNELLSVGGHHGPTFTVGKASLGVVRDWRVAKHVSVGLGGLYAVNFVPKGLEAAYGGDNPKGGMAFMRLKIN